MTSREPTTPPSFTPFDFGLFEAVKQRDNLYNPSRLKLKHKLRAMGDIAREALLNAGLPLEVRTSLSHPYTYNAFKVDAMWFYLARPSKERKALKDILGAELGEDLDPNYQHLVFFLEINEKQMEFGLRIHELAWWDTQNLKNKCDERTKALELAQLMNRLDGFTMTIHDWKKEYRTGRLSWGDIGTFMTYFVPGQHRWNLKRFVDRGDPLSTSQELMMTVCQWFALMIPIYRFIAWSNENNFLKLSA
jgi:hypothetical protein